MSFTRVSAYKNYKSVKRNNVAMQRSKRAEKCILGVGWLTQYKIFTFIRTTFIRILD